MRRALGRALGLLALAASLLSALPAAAQTVDASCVGVDHSPPYTDPGTGQPINSPSIITVAASFTGLAPGTTVTFSLLAPGGFAVNGSGTVDGQGKVEVAIPIFSFGTYEAMPIEADSKMLSPDAVFPEGTFTVTGQEIDCDGASLPPGHPPTSATTTAPTTTAPTATTTTRAPETTAGTAPPAPVSAGEGGFPWWVVIAVGILLVLVGLFLLFWPVTTPPSCGVLLRRDDRRPPGPRALRMPGREVLA